MDVRRADTTKTYAYDKLILAQGARPSPLPIAGSDLPRVFTLYTIDDLKAIRSVIHSRGCSNATVIGAGFIGLEAAENLVQLGLKVSLLEYTQHVFPPADQEIASLVETELRRNGVDVYTGQDVLEITDTATDGDTEAPLRIRTRNDLSLEADLIIIAAGVRPVTSLAAAAGLKIGSRGVSVDRFMQTSDPDIYAVGDMVETEHRILARPTTVALAGLANRQGRLAANSIFGQPVPWRGNVAVSVCQVFERTVAVVGPSVRALRLLGRAVDWVTVHTPNHAGYYPGARPMTLRLAFDPETGRILGAQAAGMEGVDKRIDVLSTCIQAEMNVFDLEHLELAYAPPYGSAKDPINMAGFVASNVMRGEVRILHACDLGNVEASWQIVDVRSEAEYSRGHLRGAVNLPVDSIRGLLPKLDRSRPVLVYCHVGYRGYLAYRILVQAGFDVKNLDGGFATVIEGGHQSFTTLDHICCDCKPSLTGKPRLKATATQT